MRPLISTVQTSGRSRGGAFRPGQDWSLEITDAQRVPLFLIKVTGHKLQ